MITCRFEDGNEGKLRHVSVGCLVANADGKILLVKRTPHLKNGDKYTIPGGFLDRDETTQQGTLRELKEETGYDGKIITLFQLIDNPNRLKEENQNVEFRYLVEVIGGEATLNSEASEIRWFSESEIPPEEDFAFDHRETIELYLKYRSEPFGLPVMS